MSDLSPTTFSPTNFINELYDTYYLDYLKERGIDPNAEDYEYLHSWCEKPTTLKFMADELSFIQPEKYDIAKNKGKHYQLLRLLVYKACNYFYNNDKNYIEFIQSILTVLEEQGISLAYEVNSIEHPDPRLHALLSIHPLHYIFYDRAVHFIRISNTSVHKLLTKMNIYICRAIQNHLKTTIFKKTKKVKTTKPTSDASDAEGRKKKSRKSKKYRKSRKSNKY